MTNYLCLILILSITACTGTLDTRPDVFIQSERLMQQGISAYRQDNYPQASKAFNKAINLYQSIDDQQGILLAHINLIKSRLAISQFTQAEQTLANLNTRMAPPALRAQITALQAHALFLQQNYKSALQTFAPLLQQIPKNHAPMSNAQIQWLMLQTKYALFAHTADAPAWFDRLTTALSKHDNSSPLQTALFNRLGAQAALQNGQIEKAMQLMHTALAGYKAKAHRRATASCLQELAVIHLAHHDIAAAKQALNRALRIRQWLQDSYKTQQITQQLTTLKQNTP